MTDNEALRELFPHKDRKGEYIIVPVEKYEELCLKAEAIEKIRAEIEEEKNDYDCIGGDFGDNTAYGLELALDIIDSHLKGGKRQ